MSNHCSDPVSCKDGNCPGCKDGQLYCSDPRCSPYCQDCAFPVQTHDFNGGMVIVVILICLIAIFFIVWFVWGPQFFQSHDDHDRAYVIVPDEYKNNQTNQMMVTQ